MEVVDTHMHFWTPATHPWVLDVKDSGHPAGPFDKVQNYLPADFLADHKGHNVTKCVHVQAEWPGDPVQETKWLMELGRSNDQGFPHTIVGFCDLSSPTANEVLTQHKMVAGDKFVGIRQLLNHHPTRGELCHIAHDNFLTDKNWLDGIGLLGQHGLTFDLHILPHQAMRAFDMIRQHPEVTFVVDHCLLAFERDEQTAKIWKEGLAALASCPNTVAKVSGMFALDPMWSSSSAVDVMSTVVSKFGITRCMFASNFPVDKVNGSYSQLMDLHEKVVGPFTQQEKASYFSELASKVYKV